MTGPLLLLETETVFSFVYVSVFTIKPASVPVAELGMVMSRKKKKVNTHSNYFLLSNFFFRSRLTWAGNAVIPAPVWQDIGVTPKLLRLFVCSNNNSNLCSHPRLLANLPSQFQL